MRPPKDLDMLFSIFLTRALKIYFAKVHRTIVRGIQSRGLFWRSRWCPVRVYKEWSWFYSRWSLRNNRLLSARASYVVLNRYTVISPFGSSDISASIYWELYRDDAISMYMYVAAFMIAKRYTENWVFTILRLNGMAPLRPQMSRPGHGYQAGQREMVNVTTFYIRLKPTYWYGLYW